MEIPSLFPILCNYVNVLPHPKPQKQNKNASRVTREARPNFHTNMGAHLHPHQSVTLLHTYIHWDKYLKGSYDIAKNNFFWCIWCNAMCLCGLRFKKHIIFHILYIIVAPLCSAFLKCVDFYKAHRSEKRGVLWFASYPVRCDWPNTSSV